MNDEKLYLCPQCEGDGCHFDKTIKQYIDCETCKGTGLATDEQCQDYADSVHDNIDANIE